MESLFSPPFSRVNNFSILISRSSKISLSYFKFKSNCPHFELRQSKWPAMPFCQGHAFALAIAIAISCSVVLASFSAARRAGFGDECGGRVRRAAAASAAFGSTSAAGGGDECGRLPLTTGGATTPSQHVGPSAFHPSALVFAAQVRQSAKSLTASRRRLRRSGDDGRRRRARPVAPPRRSHSKGDDER